MNSKAAMVRGSSNENTGFAGRIEVEDLAPVRSDPRVRRPTRSREVGEPDVFLCQRGGHVADTVPGAQVIDRVAGCLDRVDVDQQHDRVDVERNTVDMPTPGHVVDGAGDEVIVFVGLLEQIVDRLGEAARAGREGVPLDEVQFPGAGEVGADALLDLAERHTPQRHPDPGVLPLELLYRFDDRRRGGPVVGQQYVQDTIGRLRLRRFWLRSRTRGDRGCHHHHHQRIATHAAPDRPWLATACHARAASAWFSCSAGLHGDHDLVPAFGTVRPRWDRVL
jgi:hypothetical protein